MHREFIEGGGRATRGCRDGGGVGSQAVVIDCHYEQLRQAVFELAQPGSHVRRHAAEFFQESQCTLHALGLWPVMVNPGI